jgi:hypothetical protein
VAAPMPLAAPVTNATLPCRRALIAVPVRVAVATTDAPASCLDRFAPWALPARSDGSVSAPLSIADRCLARLMHNGCSSSDRCNVRRAAPHRSFSVA